MFMFLLSQPDLAHDGVIALRERRWNKSAAGLTAGQVRADLEELSTARFVVVDEDAEELLVRSFIRRDKVYRQPNVLRSAADHLRGITSGPILAGLAGELDRIMLGDDVPPAAVGILAEMRNVAQKGRPNPSRNPSASNPSESDAEPADAHVSAGGEGSGNPSAKGSGNPTPGTPGERGVVTAVRSDSPSPVPPASDPRPQSSTGGRAGAREEPPPDTCPEHTDDPDPPPCGRCAGARKARHRWDAAAAARERAAPRCRQHRGQPAHNCALCRSEQLADQETR
jgi:hypothetical protein